MWASFAKVLSITVQVRGEVEYKLFQGDPGPSSMIPDFSRSPLVFGSLKQLGFNIQHVHTQTWLPSSISVTVQNSEKLVACPSAKLPAGMYRLLWLMEQHFGSSWIKKDVNPSAKGKQSSCQYDTGLQI